MPEGCVSCEVAGKDIPCGFKFLANEAQAEEPGSHCVLGVFVLLGLGACGSDFLGHLAECQAKLNVALELACVDAVLLAVCGGVELEKSELNRPLGEGSVEVKHMVAAAVVVLASAVVLALAGVPNVCKAGHRGGLLAVDFAQEVGIDRAAVAVHAAAVQLEGLGQEAFVAGHDVCQVAESLGCVALRADVDVNSAAACRVALCSGAAKLAAKFLQAFDVGVGKDRGDHFALLIVGSADANIAGEFPLAALGVPSAPGHVAVAVGGVLNAAGSEEGGGDLGCFLAGDVVHLDLNADGLLFHLVDLVSGFLVHGVASVKKCVSLAVYTYLLYFA